MIKKSKKEIEKSSEKRNGGNSGDDKKERGVIMNIKNEEYEIMLLRSYLSRYKKCKNNEKTLLTRIESIREYKRFPLKISDNDNNGGSRSGKISNQPLAIVLEVENLEERLKKQYTNSIKTVENVINILSYLPENSDERNVLERRCIDLEEVNHIAKTLSYSRVSICRITKRGLVQLLKFEKVQEILKNYAKKIERQKELLNYEEDEE